jgi:transcriptional regulator with XRE-family HTH domain
MAIPTFLKREFARRKARNRSYSMRAFARDLGFDHSTVSQWMRGERPVTANAASQICDTLGVCEQHRQLICELNETDYQIVATARASSTCESPELARLAGVTVDRLNMSLAKLLRLNLLKMDGGCWHLAEDEFL